MRILELTNYSAGSCGVFARVKKEASWLANKGHEIKIFSSNLEKGTNRVMPSQDRIGKVEIIRFSATKLGGESFMRWNFIKEALEFKPDIIIAHSYRHLHTHLALKVAKLTGSKCILVTHAPFTTNTRSILGKIAVSFYDFFIGSKIINKFDKVVAVTKWELPFLQRLGLDKNKIEIIPSGIPDEMFEGKISEGKGFFFLGRVSPIKNIELIINSAKDIKEKFDIVGPAEYEYKRKLLRLISENGISNINFVPEVSRMEDKIKIIDSHLSMILPSKFESFGQAIVESMARGKIVISSRTPGAKEIISDGKNGLLFEINDSSSLTSAISEVLSMSKKARNSMRANARKRAEDFKMSKTMSKMESLLSNLLLET